MRKRLILSFLSVGVAVGLMVNMGRHQSGGIPVAEAGANSVTVTSQQCIGPNQVRVAFSWVGYNEGSQWVDLSLSNNDFFPGTFVGLGPIVSNQTNFTWDGILGGLTHFFRVNTLTFGGWSASPTIAFTTRNDCQFIPQVIAGVGASNLAVVNQICVQNATNTSASPRVMLNWTSSRQGQQWLDNSSFSPYFEPGTFPSVGPFAPDQMTFEWDGLIPGTVHYIRINTGTPSGWIGSPAVTLYVRTDCQALVPPPTATPRPAG